MQSLIASFYFSYFAIIGVYVIYLPKVFELVGYSPFEIGVLFTAAPIMRFLTPFFFLRHFKLTRELYNRSLLLLLLSATLFYIAIENFWLLFLANLLVGVGLSLTLPYVEVIALEVIQKERYGKIRLFGSIGFIIVALVLANYLDKPINAIHFLFLTTLLTTFFAYLVAKLEDHHNEQRSAESDEKFSMRSHAMLWISMFLMQVSFGGFYNFFTNYETSYGVSLQTVSYLWSAGVVFEIVMFYFQGSLLKNSLVKLIEISTLLTAFRWFLLFAYPQNLWVLYFSQSLHAFSFALYHSAAISYLFTIYKAKKLAQQFFLGITYGLGGMVGSFSAGIVYDYNKEYLYIFSALVTLSAYLALVLDRRKSL